MPSHRVPPTPYRAFVNPKLRCGGCDAEDEPLRRGRCPSCYERWMRARPVGVGACCAACNDRRLPHLRHFELRPAGQTGESPGFWLVLCHNCAAAAELIHPLPRSRDALLLGLGRERRQIDRREATAAGRRERLERREVPRRRADQSFDAAELVEEILLVDQVLIESELSYADDDELRRGPITQVHVKIDA